MKKTLLIAALLLPPSLMVGSALAQTPAAGNVVEQSNEYRFQLDLQVNQAALNKLLPAGWEISAVSQSGTIGTSQGRPFVAFVNLNAENNYAVTIRARKQ